MNETTNRRQFDGEMTNEFEIWLGDSFESWLPSTRQVAIRTPEGERIVNEGEWIDLGKEQPPDEQRTRVQIVIEEWISSDGFQEGAHGATDVARVFYGDEWVDAVVEQAMGANRRGRPKVF